MIPARGCLLALLLSLPLRAADPKYGPAGHPVAVTLSQDHAYLRQDGHPAPDFWRLTSFYVPQNTGYACSAASVVMALNALLGTDRARGDMDRNITQEDLLEKVKGDWTALLTPAGFLGKHGLTLAQLEAFLKAAFAFYSRDKFEIDRHEAASAGEAELLELRQALARNEADADDLIIAHFVQDDLTGAKGGPYAHISPLGAYDAARRRVLVFDVDREWYEPYWVPDLALLKAMAHATAAFGHGGFVRVRRLR